MAWVPVPWQFVPANCGDCCIAAVQAPIALTSLSAMSIMQTREELLNPQPRTRARDQKCVQIQCGKVPACAADARTVLAVGVAAVAALPGPATTSWLATSLPECAHWSGCPYSQARKPAWPDPAGLAAGSGAPAPAPAWATAAAAVVLSPAGRAVWYHPHAPCQ